MKEFDLALTPRAVLAQLPVAAPRLADYVEETTGERRVGTADRLGSKGPGGFCFY